ncbi:response regulator [Neolewinella aurantiaca]|uniref:Response regulator n=1 Tax=Neolewinella aurantiaca TaxID=2602767 RepID=A0A5C7FLR4_9BACT|nr:response regulator [Neolewinella aurantiaca]TXF90979.1 response regulator [Neolewinella aurantiaca]
MDPEIFKVFILEDQQLDLELNKRQVRKYRPDVLFAVARNRTEFREKLVDFQPDIVLSDYNLPDMNGLDALLYVREHLDGTPFVFITGVLNDEEKVADTILNGASGYLLKENLRKLPELLTTIVEQNSQVMQQRERDWERRKTNQTLLAKSIAELKGVDFPGNEKIISSLQEVADNLG